MKLVKLTIIIVSLALFAGAGVTAYAQVSPGVDQPDIRYIPEGTYEWRLDGCSDHQIIEARRVNELVWDFYITPDRTKLSNTEVSNYPFEAFYVTTVGTEQAKQITPVERGLITFESIPKDVKSISTSLVDSVDLDDNYGVRVSVSDPGAINGAKLHYGVHSATYSAVSNTITVTGSPVTYQDIYDAGVTQGWAGPCCGTLSFSQCGTQQFHSTAKIYYGDDVTPTCLDDEYIQLSFARDTTAGDWKVLQQVETNAVVKLNHCSIIDEDDSDRGNHLFNYSGGDIKFDYVQLVKLKESDLDRGRIYKFTNSSYLYNCCLDNIVIYKCGIDLTNATMVNALYPIYRPTASALFDNVVISNCSFGVAVGLITNSTFTDCDITGDSYDIYQLNLTATTTFVNSQLNDWSSSCSGTCTAGTNRKYTLDLTTNTENGTPIQNANVVITNIFGTDIANLSTSASGTIPTQTLFYGTYASGTTTADMHTPHTISIYAGGYQAHVMTVIMDKQKDLEISLLPISTGTDSADVLSWLQINEATISWWEDNMDLITQALLIAVLVVVALWQRSMVLYFVAAAGVGYIGADWWNEKTIEWGMPISALAMLLFVRGILIPIRGRGEGI